MRCPKGHKDFTKKWGCLTCTRIESQERAARGYKPASNVLPYNKKVIPRASNQATISNSASNSGGGIDQPSRKGTTGVDARPFPTPSQRDVVSADDRGLEKRQGQTGEAGRILSCEVERGESSPVEKKQRWDRTKYNAYQRDYMARRRAK